MNYTILCVDDVKTNLITLEAILESNEKDYNVLLATSGKEALEKLLLNKVDLILLDVMMPELDGFETAELILKNNKTKDIPIVFLTANQDDETIKTSYEVGGVDYMNKPFNSIELLKRIEFHLQLKESEKLILKERQQVRSLINLQDNFVLLTDGENAIKINTAMEEFFNVDSVFEFQNKHKCICSTFIDEDGSFHLGLLKKDENWVMNVIQRLKDSDVVVKIKDINEFPHTFTIKAVQFDDDLYVITFTDVTSMSAQFLEYQYEASHDSLTKIYNRNMFVKMMKEKMRQRILSNKELSLCLLDIDHFKDVNDTYGHLVGDKILVQLTKIIEKNVRSKDLFARWGGEEFILVFDSCIEETYKKIEFLRKTIENESFGEVKQITCSFGISEYKYGDVLDNIVQRADEALYEGKESGRNRVCKVK